MADLFWAYWDTSLRFGILALALLLATPVLSKWISPKWLCWAWAALILRLSVPLALPFSGSIFNLSESLQPSTWTNVLRSGVVDAGWGETVIPKNIIEDEFVRQSLIGFSWEDALVVFWILGFLVLMICLVANAFRLQRFFDRAKRHGTGRLYEIFKDTRKRFGINANVPILVSNEVKTPGIAGIFNPRVVVPKRCAEDLSDGELKCVLLHELTHYRRGDLFVHHVLLLICFLHWYNPLVWLVMRQFKLSMEQACDADVVDSECIDSREEYGLTLLRVMRSAIGSQGSPAGALCLLGNRKNGALKNRIHLIAREPRRNPVFAVLGMSVFGFSLMYAITGEKVVEKEAERLFALTRFSGPTLFVSPNTKLTSFELNPSRYMFDSASIETPQSWVQDMDISSYRGQDVVVKVRYRVAGLGESQQLWINVKNEIGRVIASSEGQSASSSGERFREIEVPMNLSKSANEMVYGLSTTGAATLWIHSVDVTVVD